MGSLCLCEHTARRAAGLLRVAALAAAIVALQLPGCSAAPEPGFFSVSFSWDEDGPPQQDEFDALWAWGYVERRPEPANPSTWQRVSESELAPYTFGGDLQLVFGNVAHGEGLHVVLLLVASESRDALPEYFGESEAFALQADDRREVQVLVPLGRTPLLADLGIADAVGPEGCERCWVQASSVSLDFQAAHAVAIELANDSDFAQSPDTIPLQGDPRLSCDADGCTLAGWELDAGLSDAADGPRSVFARLVNAQGYTSATLSASVTLDRAPPEDGALSGPERTMQLTVPFVFGVKNGEEMFLEACDGLPCDEEQDGVPDGLLPCAGCLPPERWIPYAPKGDVRLRDTTIRSLRVKFRDSARNETPWIAFAFTLVFDAEDLGWVAVPGGSFQMGCLPTDGECFSDELPRHAVTVPAFEITATEITQHWLEAATGEDYFTHADCPSCPADNADWFEADDFCSRVGGRLPTEAEWEYAARAGSETLYPCGDDPLCLDETAWHTGNSGDTTHPVAEQAPNAFGLYDMSGNVMEWVEDNWDLSYQGAPTDGSAREDAASFHKVQRGGYWGSNPWLLRASTRQHDDPLRWTSHLGFRCARAVSDGG